ncbi:diacylglycerol kinase family lipid kinase [Candidatus Woesearchaeota archaeon]|nr:diacylglycerol kinase family lipid kinase [Candidatus Woesearchaeota archaeon]
MRTARKRARKKRARKKVVVIVNPNAGFFANAHAFDDISMRKEHSLRDFTQNVIDFFYNQNIEVQIKVTKKPLDAVRFARQAANKVSLVIAAGGDGTINEVINGLAKSRTALGILPLGTENAFGRELHIPLDYKRALRRITTGKSKMYDLGLANKRYFLMMAGVGFDAHAASQVRPYLKRLLGRGSYHLTAIKTFFTHSPKLLRIWIDDQVLPRWGYFVVAGNIKYYGGNIRMTPYARPDDGFLDVCIFKNKDIFNMMKYFIGAAYKGTHVEFSDIEYFRCRQLRVESEGRALGHTDAEIIGMTPIDIRIVPRALMIIC